MQTTFTFEPIAPKSIVIKAEVEQDGFFRLRFDGLAVLSINPVGTLYIYPDQMRKTGYISRIQSRNGMTAETLLL